MTPQWLPASLLNATRGSFSLSVFAVYPGLYSHRHAQRHVSSVPRYGFPMETMQERFCKYFSFWAPSRIKISVCFQRMTRSPISEAARLKTVTEGESFLIFLELYIKNSKIVHRVSYIYHKTKFLRIMGW